MGGGVPVPPVGRSRCGPTHLAAGLPCGERPPHASLSVPRGGGLTPPPPPGPDRIAPARHPQSGMTDARPAKHGGFESRIRINLLWDGGRPPVIHKCFPHTGRQCMMQSNVK